MAKPITNRVKMGQTPVIRKDLEGGVIAEANNDGTIYIDKDVKKGSALEREAVAHEKIHLDQMNRGDLGYDDDCVYWKGKAYPRANMNEGAKNLPWEKEAYNKTKHLQQSANKEKKQFKKDMKNKDKSSGIKMSDAALVANNMQTNKSFNDIAKAMPQQPWDVRYKSDKNTNNNSGKDTEDKDSGKESTDNSNADNSPTQMKAIPITYKSAAPLKNTIAAKEFMKDYGGQSNPDEPVIKISKRKGFKDGVAGTETTTDITTMSQRGADGKISRIGGRKGSYRLQDLVGGARDGVAYTERTGEQMADAGIIHKANVDRWNKNYYKPTSAKPGKTFTSKSFDPEYMYEPGEPGKEGRYQPGYFEAASIAAAQKGFQKRGIKDQKSLEKDAKMFDKYINKEKVMYDTRTGQPYSMDEAGKSEYLKYRASLFAKPNTQSGVVSGGTTGTEGKTRQKGEGDPGTEGYVDLDGSKTGKTGNTGNMQLKKGKKIGASNSSTDSNSEGSLQQSVKKLKSGEGIMPSKGGMQETVDKLLLGERIMPKAKNSGMQDAINKLMSGESIMPKANQGGDDLVPKRSRSSAANYNKNNKNKAAFKMVGFGSKTYNTKNK